MLNDNQCFISGRLGRDPELKYTQSGKAYCRLSVACSYKVKEEERTDWVPVQVWGPLAENCGSNLQKGQRVMVRGRYSSSSYESPQGKKYFTQVVADLVAICLDGSPYANGGQGNSQGNGQWGGGQNQQQGQPQDRGNFSRFCQQTPPPTGQPSSSDYTNQPQGTPSGAMHGPGEKDEDIPF
jgi:single-strand DNA-binding protein